ncbi:cell division control protein [Tulasnella sp. 425]|nr:cell division control protein [Tulasnella sp. 425]
MGRDQTNNEGYLDTIIKYIKDQHPAYLHEELTAMHDKHIQDTRIHCCLFFINPTWHSLRPIDIIVVKKLSEVVNVVSIIARTDSLPREEREVFKNNIRAEKQYKNIRLYPSDTDENEPEELSLNETIRPIRGRKSKWGVINVEDETHSVSLTGWAQYLSIFRTHLQNLIETTAQIHCEAFRSKQPLVLKDASARPAQGSA